MDPGIPYLAHTRSASFPGSKQDDISLCTERSDMFWGQRPVCRSLPRQVQIQESIHSRTCQSSDCKQRASRQYIAVQIESSLPQVS